MLSITRRILRWVLATTWLIAAVLSPVAHAHEGHHHAATESWTMAEVKKVDVAQKKITLQHGDIENLNMPGMTMVFNVKNAKLLQGINAGDHVQFTATQEGERYFVTAIKSAH